MDRPREQAEFDAMVERENATRRQIESLETELAAERARADAADAALLAAFPAAPAASAGVDMEKVFEAAKTGARISKLTTTEQKIIDAAIAEYERQVKEGACQDCSPSIQAPLRSLESPSICPMPGGTGGAYATNDAAPSAFGTSTDDEPYKAVSQKGTPCQTQPSTSSESSSPSACSSPASSAATCTDASPMTGDEAVEGWPRVSKADIDRFLDSGLLSAIRMEGWNSGDATAMIDWLRAHRVIVEDQP